MRIACFQGNVMFGDPVANAEVAVRKLRELKGQAVELVVFPEAFLTGYCVETQEEACAIAIPLNHPSLTLIQQACEELDMLAVVGFAEDAGGGELYNSAALFEPGRDARYYRKSHLPELGLDKHVKLGDELPVFDTRLGRLAILICFDLRLPEPARVLALKGADILLLPTNWPDGAQISAEHTCIARAGENKMAVATCNRVGDESGFHFIGLSKIISATGKVLAAAGEGEETIVADVDLAESRQKRNVIVPGKFEVSVTETRRPELYEVLMEEPAVPRP